MGGSSAREAYRSRWRGSDGSHSCRGAGLGQEVRVRHARVGVDGEGGRGERREGRRGEGGGRAHLAAQDVGDAHLEVVHDGREVVRREEVGLEQDGVGGEGRVRVAEVPEYKIGRRRAAGEVRVLVRRG